MPGIIARLFLFTTFLFASGLALAANDPSMHQVYSAVQAGHLNEAQSMMNQVLRDHPNSAKAHYVEAEILARAGRNGQASSELTRAEQLAPGLPFVKAESVQLLKNSIAGSAGRTPAKHGFPWGWLLLGLASIAVITLIMRAMSRRNAVAPYRGGPQQPGVQSMYGNQPYGPTGPVAGGGMGSGILGGLATGAAMGAGMVAGEELVRHFTDGGSGTANAAPMDNFNAPADLGGSDFGINDGSSWDDGGGFDDFGGGGDWS